MVKRYTLTITIGASGTDLEKAELLARMIARIEAENAVMGQATCQVTSVVEVED
jgi:hypothetical protein